MRCYGCYLLEIMDSILYYKVNIRLEHYAPPQLCGAFYIKKFYEWEENHLTNTAVIENKALLNINEFCDYLGIGQTKARELLRGHNGFGVQIGNRWYANKRKLDAWIDKETNQIMQILYSENYKIV